MIQLLNGRLDGECFIKVEVLHKLLTIKVLDKECVRYDWEKSLEMSKCRLSSIVYRSALVAAALTIFEDDFEFCRVDNVVEVLELFDDPEDRMEVLTGIAKRGLYIQRCFRAGPKLNDLVVKAFKKIIGPVDKQKFMFVTESFQKIVTVPADRVWHFTKFETGGETFFREYGKHPSDQVYIRHHNVVEDILLFGKPIRDYQKEPTTLVQRVLKRVRQLIGKVAAK